MTKGELLLLSSKEFNQILAEDSELAELEKLKYNNSNEKFLLLDALNLGNFRIGKLPIRPLTLAKWSFLYLLGSPYCRENAEITPIDVDIFLFVTSQYDLNSINCSLSEILEESANYRLSTNLSFEEVHVECLSWIENSFYPLQMIKANNQQQNEPIQYDADWVLYVATCAAQVSNEKISDIIHKMPLSSVFMLFINYCRKNCPEIQIDKISNKEVESQISARIDILANEFLRRKNAGM